MSRPYFQIDLRSLFIGLYVNRYELHICLLFIILNIPFRREEAEF